MKTSLTSLRNACTLLFTLVVAVVCQAQTNKFPPSGSAGIGTALPLTYNSYSILDLVGQSPSNGGYIRFATSDASGQARILNLSNRLLFDLQRPGMYFQWRNSENNELYRLTENGSARWNGNASSYTEIASNQYGPYLRQYGNDGVTLSWIIRGYANNGIQAVFRNGGVEINGRVRAKEVLVETANWPDYVFAENYAPMSLTELKTYIQYRKHLPGIPTASEAHANGVLLGEMNRKLLEKIEELTLYLIQLHEENTTSQQRIGGLEAEVDQLKLCIEQTGI